ncbi:type 1 fimbria pilin [Serratia fonticola]|uniref:Type 1 fimbria pilin n=1 Tax=Serratia fonticola TaxID=47917 RepID=A0A542CWQ4_SERFO|nr:fimbrial protein [Serratia fonticola]TQI77781.1 type 1 fimbria pilin [Serratia fonticola]TQI95224.1 type 1 fimbria pilin [Serratia fonticola]TVZ69721.1 type 1 fimbria pilin [Serratia fonticola]
MEVFTGGRLRPLLLATLLPMLLLGSSSVRAVSMLEAIEGTSGTISFYGGLLTSPCSLTPDSQDQAIDLGDVNATAFQNAGDQSIPVRFRLSFRNCLLGARAVIDTPAGQRDAEATRLYLQGEQAATLIFLGDSDVHNPELLQLKGGAQGIALRLKDAQGRALSINQQSRPYILQPGNNTLWFSAQLESTQRYTQANQFGGVVHVQIVYL